jgi:putative phosphoribosyl transferase
MDLRFYNEVNIVLEKIMLEGELIIPQEANAIVIFSHGSGSSRFSPRNKLVAQQLQNAGIGTLLLDLLSQDEDLDYSTRFNIELLAERLVGATEWLEKFEPATDCRMGYFGASTGAASALKAAAYLPQVKAVISRGGRPDLAMEILHKVQVPTLLIVGSLDYDVLQLNQQAYARLKCEKKLEIVEGASHLFEEKGTMDKVTNLAVGWFSKYLKAVTVS